MAETFTADAAGADRRSNLRVAGMAFAIVAGMIGLAYASVPLYQLFCQVTGYGGTTQRAEAAPVLPAGGDVRQMDILFDANTISTLGWKFEPLNRKMTVNVGEEALGIYVARNLMGRPVTGTATFNVTPLKAGQYFNKVECFCFQEQTLQPGQEVNMPVSFFVDPAINDDPNLREVTHITLSYTFAPADDS